MSDEPAKPAPVVGWTGWRGPNRDGRVPYLPDTLPKQIKPLWSVDVSARGLGGVAVAKLEGNSCRGCHLQLSAVEVGRIRKLDPDVLVHCEECGRILVR